MPCPRFMFLIFVFLTLHPSGIAQAAQKKDNASEIMEWREAFGGLPESGQYVIRDSETWKNIWLRVRDSEIPIVDFEKKMVLAAFLGVRSTGGYSVKIEGIGKRKNKIVVAVREAKPPKNAMVIQAITSPYHIKVVDRSALPVEFKIVK